MKKLFTLAMTMLLGATLAFAQTGTGTNGQATTAPKTTGKKPTTKTSKAHKGGKKSKKGGAATPKASPTPGASK